MFFGKEALNLRPYITRTMKKKIALIAGGDSSEWKIALEGAALIEQVLDTDKYDVYKIVLHDGRWTYTAPDGATTELDRNDFTLTLGGRRIRLEYALILIHGTPGEDGRLQGYLDMMRIPYSSCGFVTSVITFDKAACKRALHGAGLNMAREILLDRHSQVDPDEAIGGWACRCSSSRTPAEAASASRKSKRGNSCFPPSRPRSPRATTC